MATNQFVLNEVAEKFGVSGNYALMIFNGKRPAKSNKAKRIKREIKRCLKLRDNFYKALRENSECAA